jgi:hypothetical protein
MLIRLGITLAVLCLALASGYGNYQHVESLGIAVIGVIIGGEALKIFLPIAMTQHHDNGHIAKLIASFIIWIVVVVTSFVNTFGNALTRQAQQDMIATQKQAAIYRPVSVIMADIRKLECGKKEKKCNNRLQLLNEELELSRANPAPKIEANSDQTKAGLQLISASIFATPIAKENTIIYVALLWTLLAELGSAFGGLAIPIKREK